ncbi:MAG: VWA domain-containing protein [Candidatus Sumerlaeaceae bacterium]
MIFPTLAYPEALILGALLIYLYWKFVRNKNWWRTALVVVAVLLLCYPSISRRTKSMDLYLLVDRSRSISNEARGKEQELLELAARNLQPGDRLGVVSFNEKGYIEQVPSQETTIKNFQIPYSEDASDLAEGMNTVLSLAPETRRTKMLVLSDGEYTGQDPLREAQIARQRKIPIYYRDLKRADIFNLFVSDVETPDKILTNEPFRATFRVNSTVDTPGRYRVYRDNKIIGETQDQGWRSYNFKAGANRIPLTDNLKNTGIHSYRIEVQTTPAEQEMVKTDNQAEKFVSVVGERPVLLVNNTGQPDNVAQVLTAGGLQLHLADIDNFHLGVNQFEGYKGIILNNVAITRITRTQIEGLRDFVLQEGGGLLVCGGNQSFSAGGYYRSPLETVLPVALEDRKQSKKVSTAFSFVIDRSGSMAMTVPSGQTKIQLADAAAIEALSLLTGADSLSVIPVDSAAHIFVPQQPVSDTERLAAEIRKIESMGGGIFVYTGLVAAGSEITKATQLNKHILLFADAADAEEPGDYKVLLEKFKEAGITVSVIGLGNEKDPDAEFLKDVAARGNGQVYFTEDAHQLIQFFTADTITYARKSFVEEAAPMKVRGAAYTIAPDQKWADFTCSGYNLLFPREKADVGIATADADNAPILAFWQTGLGRAASIALDCDKAFAQTPNYPDIILNTTRWIMGSNVFDNLQIKSDMDNNYARIRMEVGDEERAQMGEVKLLMFTPNGYTISKPMQWDSHNRLSASVKLEEVGCYRGVVQMGDKSYKIGPVSMPVSPEFAYDKGPSAGREMLAQMATITGGREILDVRTIFDRVGTSVGTMPLVTPLLILFVLLLLGEIAEARFGMLAAAIAWAKRRTLTSQAAVSSWSLRGRRTAPLADTLQDTTPLLKARTRELRTRRKAEPTDLPQAQPGVQEPGATPGTTPEPEQKGEDMGYLSSAKTQARRALRDRKKP